MALGTEVLLSTATVIRVRLSTPSILAELSLQAAQVTAAKVTEAGTEEATEVITRIEDFESYLSSLCLVFTVSPGSLRALCRCNPPFAEGSTLHNIYSRSLILIRGLGNAERRQAL